MSTTTVWLNKLAGQGLQHTFLIESSGQPGDVQAHLFSNRQGTEERIELLAKDAQDGHNAGSHPWSIENGNSSTLLLFNPTSSSQEFQVRIFGERFSWIQLYTLASLETKAITINDLIQKQTPDKRKLTIPATAVSGEASWSTQVAATGLGRLLVANPALSLARNFSCTNIYTMCQVSFGPQVSASLILQGASAEFYGVSAELCPESNQYSCILHANGESASAMQLNLLLVVLKRLCRMTWHR